MTLGCCPQAIPGCCPWTIWGCRVMNATYEVSFLRKRKMEWRGASGGPLCDVWRMARDEVSRRKHDGLGGIWVRRRGPLPEIERYRPRRVGALPGAGADVLATASAATSLRGALRPGDVPGERLPARRRAARGLQGDHVPGVHRGDGIQPRSTTPTSSRPSSVPTTRRRTSSTWRISRPST